MAKGTGSGGRSTPESRVRAAAEGQPAIVREAMFGGVSTLRVSLTDKERRQLSAARRKGLLSVSLSDPFRRTLEVSPRVLFGR